MDHYQQLFDVLTRARPANRQSKAASVQEQPAKEMVTICKKEYEDLKDNKCANIIKQTIRKSMAASLSTKTNGINQAQLIHNFITS